VYDDELYSIIEELVKKILGILNLT
jgi:hypothetical protein